MSGRVCANYLVLLSFVDLHPLRIGVNSLTSTDIAQTQNREKKCSSK